MEVRINGKLYVRSKNNNSGDIVVDGFKYVPLRDLKIGDEITYRENHTNSYHTANIESIDKYYVVVSERRIIPIESIQSDI